MTIVLASGSPRRLDLLRTAGYACVVDPADVDETRAPGETALQYVARLAAAKARAVASRHPAAVVIAADTTVVVGSPDAADGEVLGKPLDADDAAGMLRRLSGRRHDVLTGVAVVSAEGIDVFVDRTGVWFADLSEDDIRWYVASGEPMDKAGGYAIQGLASRFVRRIDGSHANVVGLPVAQVHERLQVLARRGPAGADHLAPHGNPHVS